MFGNYRAAINLPIGFLTILIIPIIISRLRNRYRKDTGVLLHCPGFQNKFCKNTQN